MKITQLPTSLKIDTESPEEVAYLEKIGVDFARKDLPLMQVSCLRSATEEDQPRLTLLIYPTPKEGKPC